MEFEKVEVTIPKEVKEFYDFLYTCDEETRIMGTYLTERYQKKLSFHVHLVANRTFFYETIQAVCDHFHIEFERLQLSTYSCEFLYKGYRFELFFVEQPEEEVYLQDIRLNEIVYYQDKTRASKEWIQDINDKMIRTGIVKNPLDTLIRLFDYQERFSFTLDRKSIHSFTERFNEEKYTASYVKEYLDKNVSNELAETIIAQTKIDNGDAQVKFTLTKENPNALFYLKRNRYRIHRDVFEKIYGKEGFVEETFTYTFSSLPGMKEVKVIQSNIEKEIQKNKVKLLFHYPKETPIWLEESKNPLFVAYVLPEIIKKIGREQTNFDSFFKNINEYSKEIKEVTEEMVKVPPVLTMNVTTDVPLFSEIDADDYVNDLVVKLTIEGIGYLVFHKQTKTIFQSTLKESIEHLLKEPIEYVLQGGRENGL